MAKRKTKVPKTEGTSCLQIEFDFVAKNMNTFNHARVFVDRKKKSKGSQRSCKHKGRGFDAPSCSL